ncbi:hypothetical protein LNTAR_14537 [Lentisphaera araneosa HTCC2155]|uniref:Acyltransferase 3 domain-containing protein n=1 Tax=Lentisphaera araneosa HTCC2155 TaxID=313628 RepID=A6DHF9_9BACT|nr:acyltransferase [Lentisphaera araneosa]EDM29042.1 hypothetical protein LNTAR_14537 [Lentisphaera araneosa HTCC2155]
MSTTRFKTPPYSSGMFDAFRWVAALVVLLCHARSMFYGSYSDIENPTILDTTFYIITLFWHQAVIIFFVLSGYFIGSSVLASVTEGKFNWTTYLINRMSRLYIVLIPILLITALLDHLGMNLWGIENYFGAENRLSIIHWITSLLMIQPQHIMPYGTNTPLWSLSYEFWYYLLFPVIVLALDRKQNKRHRVIMFVILIPLLLFMEIRMASYFIIWSIGVAVAVLPLPKQWLRIRWQYPLIGFCTLLVFVLIRGLERTIIPVKDFWYIQLITDMILSIVFAGFMYSTKVKAYLKPKAQFPLIGFHNKMASFSYTLYLIHNPILVFIYAGFLFNDGLKLEGGLFDLMKFLGLMVFVMFIAYFFSLLTECNTPYLRKWLRRKLE